MKALFPAVILALVSSGCAVVKMHRVRDDYAAVDQAKVKRITVVTQPLPDGKPAVGALFSKVSRRYVHMKRDFLLVGASAQAEALNVSAACTEGVDGVLWLEPTLTAKGDGFEASLKARLLRCGDGQEVWAAEAGGSFPSHDEGLKEVAQTYAGELGPDVVPYVPTAMNLLRPTLDTLPQPKVSEDDLNEKMGLDD